MAEQSNNDVIHEAVEATIAAADEATRQQVVAAAPVIPFDTSKPRLVEPVEIELDRTRHLRLPFWALKRYEKATGKSAWEHAPIWGWPPDLGCIIALVWAGLLDEDPDLTLEQAERMPGMEFGNILYLQARLDELWGRSQPDPEPAGATDPNPPKAIPVRTAHRTG